MAFTRKDSLETAALKADDVEYIEQAFHDAFKSYIENDMVFMQTKFDRLAKECSELQKICALWMRIATAFEPLGKKGGVFIGAHGILNTVDAGGGNAIELNQAEMGALLKRLSKLLQVQFKNTKGDIKTVKAAGNHLLLYATESDNGVFVIEFSLQPQFESNMLYGM